MKRLPVFATLIVMAACLTMVALGIWQLRRAAWKEALLADYAAVRTLPPIAFPKTPDPKALPLFRRSQAYCLSVASWQAVSGRNLGGEAGWVHVARCRSGAEGPGFSVVAGWSRSPASPVWAGGAVTGTIAGDPEALIRLVSATPLAPELEAAAPPDINQIPNNHLAYAVQWFLFAAIAFAIFALALVRRRQTS